MSQRDSWHVNWQRFNNRHLKDQEQHPAADNCDKDEQQQRNMNVDNAFAHVAGEAKASRRRDRNKRAQSDKQRRDQSGINGRHERQVRLEGQNGENAAAEEQRTGDKGHHIANA